MPYDHHSKKAIVPTGITDGHYLCEEDLSYFELICGTRRVGVSKVFLEVAFIYFTLVLIKINNKKYFYGKECR